MAFKTTDGTWRVLSRVVVDGRYKRVSRNFPTKALAERYEAEVRLKKHEPGFFSQATSSSVTFAEFAKRWLTEYCRVEKAASQWTEDEAAIRRYLEPAFGDVALSALSRRHLVELKTKLASTPATRSGAPLKPKTVNNVVALAKKMLGTAVEWELLAANPFGGVRGLPVNEEPMAYWTIQERDFFLRFAAQHDPEFARLVTVAAHTGLRRSELAGLQRYQLDFERRQIQVSAAHCFKAERRVERTKNRAVGYVPMNPVVFGALQHLRLAAPTALVFGPELTRHASVRFRRLCAKVGARPIRFHDLRHTFASCLVAAGVEIYTVQQMMRHKTITMTQRYAHLAPEHLADAALRLVEPGSTGDTDSAPTRETRS